MREFPAIGNRIAVGVREIGIRAGGNFLAVGETVAIGISFEQDVIDTVGVALSTALPLPDQWTPEQRADIVARLRDGLTSKDNVFVGNTFIDNVTGGAIMFSKRITLQDNRFSANRSAASSLLAGTMPGPRGPGCVVIGFACDTRGSASVHSILLSCHQ
mgnify:CR=1 FL=1